MDGTQSRARDTSRRSVGDDHESTASPGAGSDPGRQPERGERSADSAGSDQQASPSPVSVLLDRLEVRKNAAIGIGVGLATALAAYLFRVFELWGPFRGTRTYPVVGPEAWFLLLAVVLAVTLGMLVTVGLTVTRAVIESKNGAERSRSDDVE